MDTHRYVLSPRREDILPSKEIVLRSAPVVLGSRMTVLKRLGPRLVWGELDGKLGKVLALSGP